MAGMWSNLSAYLFFLYKKKIIKESNKSRLKLVNIHVTMFLDSCPELANGEQLVS